MRQAKRVLLAGKQPRRGTYLEAAKMYYSKTPNVIKTTLPDGRTEMRFAPFVPCLWNWRKN